MHWNGGRKSGNERQQRSHNLQYKYLRIILNQEEIDNQEINRIIKARRIIACLNDILWKASRKKGSSTFTKLW